ncbi:Cytochrome P450 734A1 [Ananas comosus]|uniref:Cytochrome P450 734A1 n=1 Tax=Ananas comosus TaxID=4615 RepID=A0A199V4N7_ANACO|nr:Cytochrome P450 734A1 [Ananas comosus]
MDKFEIIYFSLSFLVFFVLQKLLFALWWNPLRIQKQFHKQGIRGPQYRLVIGSLKELAVIYRRAKEESPTPTPLPLPLQPQSCKENTKHNLVQHIFPHLPPWINKYGKNFLFWFGPLPRIVVTEPELIKKMFSDPKEFILLVQHPALYQLIGKALPLAEGDAWATNRKLLSPFFNLESLKGLSHIVIEATEKLVETWSDFAKSGEWEADVYSEFEELVQNIAADVVFGRNAKEGKYIGHLQMKQENLIAGALRNVYIPGTRFLPTSFNLSSNWLRKEVDRLLMQLIKRRGANRDTTESDLLGYLLSSSMPREQIKEECRVFSVAAYETVSILLSWTFIMLGTFTEWQDKAREEVSEVLKGNNPSFETLSRLKILNMIINETLRLYPPVPTVIRGVKEDTKLANLTVPAGTGFIVPIIAIHHDKDLWGENADVFDPSRFSEGVAKAAKHPMAFMPFTVGPRICIGMNFVLMEAKIILAMLLQKFRFVVSPNYKHEPSYSVIMKPGKGAQIILTRI